LELALAKNRAREAANAAICSSTESSIGSQSCLHYRGSDLTLHEVNTAAETIYEVVDPNANIILGQ